jgi:hypothetical protein
VLRLRILLGLCCCGHLADRRVARRRRYGFFVEYLLHLFLCSQYRQEYDFILPALRAFAQAGFDLKLQHQGTGYTLLDYAERRELADVAKCLRSLNCPTHKSLPRIPGAKTWEEADQEAEAAAEARPASSASSGGGSSRKCVWCDGTKWAKYVSSCAKISPQLIFCLVIAQMRFLQRQRTGQACQRRSTRLLQLVIAFTPFLSRSF